MNKTGVIKDSDSRTGIVIPKEIREKYGLFGSVEIVVTDEWVLIRSPELVLVKPINNKSESYCRM